MLNICTVQGQNNRDYAVGTVDFTKGEGMDAFDDYLREQYPGFYESKTLYRGNYGMASALNHVLERLEPSEDIDEFVAVETEPGENVDGTRLDIALTPDALEALRASLDASPFESSARFESPLTNHLRRVVQQRAVDKTDYERP